MMKMKNDSLSLKKRITAFALFAVLIMSFYMPSTYNSIAYLSSTTEKSVNTFAPGKVSCTIEEDFDGKTKSNVKVRNDNSDQNITAFIRVAVAVNWQKNNTGTDGSVPVYSASAPAVGKDYYLELEKNTGWFLASDGYYYFAKPVNRGMSTETLIKTCKPLVEKQGYHLSVDIAAEAIQYVPKTAVDEEWKAVKVQNGTLVKNGGAG